MYSDKRASRACNPKPLILKGCVSFDLRLHAVSNKKYLIFCKNFSVAAYLYRYHARARRQVADNNFSMIKVERNHPVGRSDIAKRAY